MLNHSTEVAVVGNFPGNPMKIAIEVPQPADRIDHDAFSKNFCLPGFSVFFLNEKNRRFLGIFAFLLK